jgi:hypothetical protein
VDGGEWCGTKEKVTTAKPLLTNKRGKQEHIKAEKRKARVQQSSAHHPTTIQNASRATSTVQPRQFIECRMPMPSHLVQA